MNDVTAFYNRTLKESPEALRYLQSRGLTDSEKIDRFQFGFANRKLRLTLSVRIARPAPTSVARAAARQERAQILKVPRTRNAC